MSGMGSIGARYSLVSRGGAYDSRRILDFAADSPDGCEPAVGVGPPMTGRARATDSRARGSVRKNGVRRPFVSSDLLIRRFCREMGEPPDQPTEPRPSLS